jgi:hypothetical protein
MITFTKTYIVTETSPREPVLTSFCTFILHLMGCPNCLIRLLNIVKGEEIMTAKYKADDILKQ